MFKNLTKLIFFSIFLSVSASCRLLNPNICTTVPSYGGSQANYISGNILELEVSLGDLEDTSQYKLVMTTTEYPDNAPPYAGATNIIPLSSDYTFVSPTPNTARDPFLLPATGCLVHVQLYPNTKPNALLYFYLIKKLGDGYVPSGKPHITTNAELFK